MEHKASDGQHCELAEHNRALAAKEPNELLRLLYVGLAERHGVLAKHKVLTLYPKGLTGLE